MNQNVGSLLKDACADAGLDDNTTLRVLLCFSIRYGKSLLADADRAALRDYEREFRD